MQTPKQIEKHYSELYAKDVKQVGKVFSTNFQTTKCECGEMVIQKAFGEARNIDVFLGICKCKNVFVAQFPV